MEKLRIAGVGVDVHIEGDLFSEVIAAWKEGGHTSKELEEIRDLCAAISMQVDYNMGGMLSSIGALIPNWPQAVSSLMILPHMICVLDAEGKAQELVRLLEELGASLDRAFSAVIHTEDILNEKR